MFEQFQAQLSDLKALVSAKCSSSPRRIVSSVETLISLVRARARARPVVSEGKDEACPSGTGISSPEAESAVRWAGPTPEITVVPLGTAADQQMTVMYDSGHTYPIVV